IAGHIISLRLQKHTAFLHLSDGSTPSPLQVVLPPSACEGLNAGCSVRLRGRLVRSRGKGQSVEFAVPEGGVELEGACDPLTYPLQNKQIRPETLRENAHLRPRLGQFAAVLRLRHHLARETHAWFEENGFWNVSTPVLTSSDCEGAGEVFSVQPDTPHSLLRTPSFFGRPAYLTVSAQLHLESLCSGLSRVYTLSPAFRAEPSLTHRHLAEFGMLEAEVGWPAGLGGVMDGLEGLLTRVLGRVVRGEAGEEVRLLRGEEGVKQLQKHAEGGWKRITYTQAVALLQEAEVEFVFPPTLGLGLQSEHEKWLASNLGPVFVTHYPKGLKPFYMRASSGEQGVESEGGTVECFDLLVPGIGELAGGSLREERLSLLSAAMDAHGLPRAEYEWYLDLRRYGRVPTGGYGLGWERLVSWITGTENVRDCIPFPRWAGSIVL
ncbi:asparaginyl-tRNA synthetase, partial [Calocera viscosa TUFC12733]